MAMLACGGRGRLALPAVVVAVALMGCENRPPEPAATLPDDWADTVLKTPEDAARNVLTYLQAELRARARHDEQTVRACAEKLRALAAVKTIEQTLARLPQFKTLVGDDAVQGYVDNWGATIAYYAEGLHLEQMRRAAQSNAKVAVIVPASAPDDDALIQVTCVNEGDQLWRIARIEFVVEPPAAAPTSQAALQPASQP